MNLVYEKYNSIKEFVDTIDKRNVNSVFKGRGLASKEGSHTFTGTNSMDEAKALLLHGYDAPLKNIEKGLKANSVNKKFKDIPKVRPRNNVVGVVPHVPNSLLGLPESMINLEKTTNKVKVVSINYDMSISCSYVATEIEKSGTALLSIINLLELRGYRVELNVIAFSGEKSNELAIVKVKVKDYKQPLDLLKCCFPLVHPSFFRRLGFRWLETVPNLTEHSFSSGYGAAVANSGYERAVKVYKDLEKNKDTYYFNVNLAKSLHFNTESILKRVGLNKLVE